MKPSLRGVLAALVALLSVACAQAQSPPAANPAPTQPAPSPSTASPARPTVRAVDYLPLQTGRKMAMAGKARAGIFGTWKTNVSLHDKEMLKFNGQEYHHVRRDVEGVPFDMDRSDHFRHDVDGVHQAFVTKKGEFRCDRLVMPASIAVGDVWKVERPNGKVDRVEAVGLESLKINGVAYENCLFLRTRPNSDMDDDDDAERTDRWFAPGIGIVKQVQVTGRYTLELELQTNQN